MTTIIMSRQDPVKLLQIPETTLAELLLAANRTETPQEFLRGNEVSLQIQSGIAYRRRAKAAGWNKLWMLASTLFSLVSFLSSHSLEDFLSVVLLIAMTATEFKVESWFIEADRRGAVYGFWNQTAFALSFLVYGTWHAATAAVPPEASDLLGTGFNALYLDTSRLTYIAIGLAGGIGQFLLARYYYRALATQPLSRQ